jgi:DNA-binding NtrC family response regulator
MAAIKTQPPGRRIQWPAKFLKIPPYSSEITINLLTGILGRTPKTSKAKNTRGEMRLRILFVEDHNDSRHTLARLLRHYSYDVFTASDYRTACSLLNASRFDVLLSDIRLPDGNGCNLVLEAKSKQPLVAIALSALGSSQDEERGMSCGFDHYFVKPLDVCRLRAILDRITARRS